MHPILFRIPIFGGVTIYTYGFMVALAFLVALFWVSRESKLKGLNPARAMDLCFYVIVSGIVGSRLLHVLISERSRFLENPLIFFKIWEGGLVFYGGLIAAIITAYWYMKKHQLYFWSYADVFTPAISIGHAIGRLGCFMAGCCFGRPLGYDAWFSIIFPAHEHGFAPTGIPLYPTQLMEAIGELFIFGMLLVVRSKKRFEGQLLATYLIAYAILRAFVEYFRGDVVRGFVIDPWFSTSQFISVIMLIIGLAIYVKRWKEK
ncbi:MAG: prolipoprotein diacylglyceryl transferase [Pseudomonadota bacterium]